MSWLLDTCVVSELVKPSPNAGVVGWLADCDEAGVFLCVMTLGELEKGVARLQATARRAKLHQWVRRDVVERFHGRMLPIDAPVIFRWGALVGGPESQGVPLPVIDSLIAATALVHDLTVVTRNVADFAKCGARCFNPWTAR